MPTAAAKRPTLAKLRRWAKLERLKLSLRRQASDAAKLQTQLEDELLLYVQAKGGKQRCVLASGFRLLITDKRDNVSWKGLYVDEYGLAAAEALIESQPTSEVLVVEPPTGVPGATQ